MRRTYCFKMYRSKRNKKLHSPLGVAASASGLGDVRRVLAPAVAA